MCTSLFMLDAHPALLLLLLFNRDEFYNRCAGFGGSFLSRE
jgi:uncharacterized protein with NRDE domain